MNLRLVVTSADFAAARQLFRAYIQTPGVTVCAVGFEEELAQLETHYSVILLALEAGQPIGCGALRRFDAERAEMKRVYVDPAHRGSGAGRALVESLLLHARDRGYSSVVLDTLPCLDRAIALYLRLGFQPIPPYSPANPPEAQCFELKL